MRRQATVNCSLPACYIWISPGSSGLPFPGHPPVRCAEVQGPSVAVMVVPTGLVNDSMATVTPVAQAMLNNAH